MKDNLLEKLMQLFDERLSKQNADSNSTGLNREEQFIPPNWGGLSNIENNTYYVKKANSKSKRILSPEEKLKFTKKSFQFIEQLIQADLIGERTFELIINQLLFSESDFVPLQETKWIIQRTLEDSLTKNQLGFLNLILYGQEEQVQAH